MRIKNLIAVCFSIAISTISIAQDENTVLWKISGNGLDKPSYLFGTIHVICPDDFSIKKKTLNALSESEQLFLELDMDNPDFVTKTQQLSLNPGMSNISSKIEKEDLELLNEFYTSNYGADLSQLGIMKPFTLMSLMVIKGLDCSEPASYEEELMGYAKAHNWEVKGLETIEDQFSIFDKVSEEEQIQWLLDYANSMDDLKGDMSRLVEVYKSEDINAMLNLMSEYPEYKQIEDELLYDRNEKWITTIEANAKEKSTFFAMGAAHLASNKGVIALLKKEGYTVTPVL